MTESVDEQKQKKRRGVEDPLFVASLDCTQAMNIVTPALHWGPPHRGESFDRFVKMLGVFMRPTTLH